jgi:hypothetical protein
MNPVLVTLYGQDARMGSATAAIVTAAVTNVVSDVAAVRSGGESIGTAILNTLFPYIGKAVGAKMYPGESPYHDAPAPVVPATDQTVVENKEAEKKAAIMATVPFAGVLIYQIAKGIVYAG